MKVMSVIGIILFGLMTIVGSVSTIKRILAGSPLTIGIIGALIIFVFALVFSIFVFTKNQKK